MEAFIAFAFCFFGFATGLATFWTVFVHYLRVNEHPWLSREVCTNCKAGTSFITGVVPGLTEPELIDCTLCGNTDEQTRAGCERCHSSGYEIKRVDTLTVKAIRSALDDLVRESHSHDNDESTQQERDWAYGKRMAVRWIQDRFLI